MRILCVHPSSLMYSRIYLRLEPLGLELVAAAARNAGHGVELIDLQSETHDDYFRRLERFRPHVVAFSGNYLANVPEIVDLAKATKERVPEATVVVGGHSIPVRYLTPRALRRAFSPEFHVEIVEPHGLVLPPPYLGKAIRHGARRWDPWDRWWRDKAWTAGLAHSMSAFSRRSRTVQQEASSSDPMAVWRRLCPPSVRCPGN